MHFGAGEHAGPAKERTLEPERVAGIVAAELVRHVAVDEGVVEAPVIEDRGRVAKGGTQAIDGREQILAAAPERGVAVPVVPADRDDEDVASAAVLERDLVARDFGGVGASLAAPGLSDSKRAATPRRQPRRGAADDARVVDVARLDPEQAAIARELRRGHTHDLDVVDASFVDGECEAPLVNRTADPRLCIAVAFVAILQRLGCAGRAARNRRTFAQVQEPQDVVSLIDRCALELQLTQDGLLLGRGEILCRKPCRNEGKAECDQGPLHQGTGTSSSGLKFPSVSRKARTVLVPCASDTITWNIDGSVRRTRSVSDGPDGPLGCE